MEVLLTGGTSYLGSVIARVLEKDYSLMQLNFPDTTSSLHFEGPNRVKITIHAACKLATVVRTVAEEKAYVARCMQETTKLLHWLETNGLPEQFVMISSVAVYGREVGDRINEDYLLAAKDCYGRTLIAVEELVTKWCADKGVLLTVLRLPLVAGKGDSGNFGAMCRAISKGYYFNIGGGQAKKSMVLAEDVAAFIPEIARVGGVYNLTDGEHPTFRTLSEAIAKSLNKKNPLNLPLLITQFLGKIGDLFGNRSPLSTSKIVKMTSDLTFDDSKVRTVASWQPKSVVDWCKTNNL